MNANEFQKLAVRTKAKTTHEINVHILNKTDLLHAALGLATEVGEFVDALKKHIFYGAPFDRINAIEELGDILWYVAEGAEALNCDLSVVMEANIAKLRTRYPEQFTSDKAVNRDLKAEAAVLKEPSTEQQNNEKQNYTFG